MIGRESERAMHTTFVMETKLNINCSNNDEISNSLNYSSMIHSKKVVKHALRQQVKRRRKNTTIAAGNSRCLPRIIHGLSSATTDISLSGLHNQHNHNGNIYSIKINIFY